MSGFSRTDKRRRTCNHASDSHSSRVCDRGGQPCPRAGSGAAPETPTIDELISLKRAGSATISPNAQWVAYTVRDTNWDENAYHTEIWLADAKSGELRQLTSHAKKSSTSPTWAPDSSTLAFATDRDDKRQVYLIDPRGGEARKLTSAEEGVGGFAFSPDGKSLAFTSADPKTDADKDREKNSATSTCSARATGCRTCGTSTSRRQDAAPDQRRVHRRPIQLVARRRARSPSITASIPRTPAAPLPTSLVSVADGKVRRSSRRPAPTPGPCGRPTDRRSPLPRR